MGPPFVGTIETRLTKEPRRRVVAHGIWRREEATMPRNFSRRVQIDLIAVLVLLVAVGGATVSNSAATPASSVHIVTYRVSLAISYSGQGPTKISCLHDVVQPDGSTLQQSYAINGSASENATLRTAKAAVLTVFIGGGNAGRYFQSDPQKPGRATVNVSRANVAPSEPCQRDP